MSTQVFIAAFFAIFLQEINGHGMVLDPPNRSSLWRYNPIARINYDDNQNFCGGAWVQWGINGGKCGVCGDAYDTPHPQPNENTGTFGQGIIAKTYQAGSVIDVLVYLKKSHLGSFTFSLCELANPNAPEPGEDCFKPLTLADGSSQFPVTAADGDYVVKVQLPAGQTIERGVLRWNYRTGNSWGDCGDGTWALGCGEQETFRTCSDISIV